ncbi:hypothetical protein CT0861_10919 [Colletotrichum tofieldiae]|uniref:Uncharacterized protein n=1 Tax=Colletotrichum tofieldiae TaxID=708197 RepID=A0A161V543_9PEZI|nr:hypothetical protein CT0861_10919 [Colletotrichum tofieldiae]
MRRSRRCWARLSSTFSGGSGVSSSFGFSTDFSSPLSGLSPDASFSFPASEPSSSFSSLSGDSVSLSSSLDTSSTGIAGLSSGISPFEFSRCSSRAFSHFSANCRRRCCLITSTAAALHRSIPASLISVDTSRKNRNTLGEGCVGSSGLPSHNRRPTMTLCASPLLANVSSGCAETAMASCLCSDGTTSSPKLLTLSSFGRPWRTSRKMRRRYMATLPLLCASDLDFHKLVSFSSRSLKALTSVESSFSCSVLGSSLLSSCCLSSIVSSSSISSTSLSQRCFFSCSTTSPTSSIMCRHD